MYKSTDTCTLTGKQMNIILDTLSKSSEKIESLTKLNEALQFALQKEKVLVTTLLKREQEHKAQNFMQAIYA